MDTSEHGTPDVAAVDSPVHWHFRALPNDVQRGTIRRLAIRGLHEQEIAARTGLTIESVRRAVSEDECLKALRALAANGSFRSRFAHRGSMAN